MLLPKRTKHRKQMRGRMKGKETRGAQISFGDIALQVTEPGWISSRQIEAARRAMARHIKRGGRIWIRIFPDKPVTQKPAETRMGAGKGNPEYWVAVVRPGRIVFEIAGIDLDLAHRSLELAASKFPVKCKITLREGLSLGAKG